MSNFAELYMMVDRLLCGDFVGSEMVWWRDDRKPLHGATSLLLARWREL